MFRSHTYLAAGLLALAANVHAANFVFDSDPFAGTTALTDAGRQIVGGPGTPITFNIATDVLAFDIATFGVSDISFANGLSTSLPTSGINFVVLQNGAPLNAGAAADAIADQITEAGPGFFIYFNSGLNLPRLVYSTDLSVNTADLAILARLTNLGGTTGFALLPTITEANANTVPEPSSILLASAGALVLAVGRWRRHRARG